MKKSLIIPIFASIFMLAQESMSMEYSSIPCQNVVTGKPYNEDTTLNMTKNFLIPEDFTKIECQFAPMIRPPHARTYKTSSMALSYNWSGYVAAVDLSTSVLDSVEGVYGTWIVPTITAPDTTTETTHCAIWVGIDGHNNSTVEQIGTDHEWVNGEPKNYAWHEMYPAASFRISNFPVDIGDTITASSEYIGTGTFQLSIANVTQQVYVVIPTSNTISTSAQRSTAEWIVEAMSSSGSIYPLSHFGTINLSNCTALINNVQGNINNIDWQAEAVEMIVPTVETPKAIPSALSASGTAFSVTWAHE